VGQRVGEDQRDPGVLDQVPQLALLVPVVDRHDGDPGQLAGEERLGPLPPVGQVEADPPAGKGREVPGEGLHPSGELAERLRAGFVDDRGGVRPPGGHPAQLLGDRPREGHVGDAFLGASGRQIVRPPSMDRMLPVM
jgi:hypothetical protein